MRNTATIKGRIPSATYRTTLGAFLGLALSAPLQAGLIEDLGNSLGSVLSAAGVGNVIDLSPAIALADSDSDFDTGDSSAPADLGMSDLQQAQLLTMDEPASTSAEDGNAPLALAAGGPLSEARDQPAIDEQSQVDPRFQIAYIQKDLRNCPDNDRDGVCDREDQCRDTPPKLRVMANGCHLDGARGLRLEGVNFATATAQLSEDARTYLNEAVIMLRQSPAALVEVAGHTDHRGSSQFNLRLSQQRAAAVLAYLVSQGIPPERLISKGYGEDQPLEEGDSPLALERNRRVELRVVQP
ncbi:MAG: OmpA family protein [Spongiibacter sp.]|nr:OmpA family protein [Spongiibacter sp.]